MMMTGGPIWEEEAKIAPDTVPSPYLHWALDQARDVAPSAPGAIIDPSAAWLRQAVRQALGTTPDAWGGILHRFLPTTSFPPASATPGSAGTLRTRNLPHAQDQVIIAVIDDAIAFAQERLRLADYTSRVGYLWLQGAEHDGANASVPFGREFERNGIEALLQGHRRGMRGDRLDEEGLYRKAGALDMSSGSFQSLARRAGHGTAIVDLVAGFAADSGNRDRTFRSLPERMGIKPEAYDLALVSLPQSVTADTSGTFAEIFILAALVRIFDYVEARSQRDGKDYPVVVNLSFGLTAGPRDGSSALDRFIDAVTEVRGPDRAPVRVVMPAGNHRLTRSHAVIPAAPPDAAPRPPLYWRLAPDDATPSFMEIWSAQMETRPKRCPIGVGLRPGGTGDLIPLGPVDYDTVHRLTDGERFLARAYVQWVPGDGKAGRVRVTLGVPPTRPTRAGAPFVAPGDWEISLTPTAEGASAWPLELTIQRDDMIPGFRGGGRQSRFVDPIYRERTAAGWPLTRDEPDALGRMPVVRRSGTLNALATARNTVVVGGCFADTLAPVSYSGEGSDSVRGPDVAAPASVSRFRGGIRVAGSRSGSRIGVEGTSAAAPTLARELAKAMRPPAERPRLSGLSLLRASVGGNNPPTVLPIAEDVTQTYEATNSVTQS